MNNSTARQWAMYSSHRQHIEKLITPASPGGRICVFGAGNCNDLDLHWLTQVYSQSHLVDLDAGSLASAVDRQRPPKPASICLWAPFDLSGIGDVLRNWRQAPPSDDQIGQCIERIEQSSTHHPRDKERFDLVLSPCVLSQILISARQSIGATHRVYPKIRDALLAHHLKMAYRSIKPGGRCVIVIDLASTEEFGSTAGIEEDQLPDLMRSLIARKKCFNALTPAALAQAAHQHLRITAPFFTAPWLWHLGLAKSFLVFAMVLS
ncbi:MAG TPA: hypothetical protein VFW23_11195 [Tepidisphaeraceae bacterium]|nr:hypothetical protein [Tepidisphaeraceae bacterium]